MTVTTAQLDERLDWMGEAPRDSSVLDHIVRRPEPGEREVVDSAEMDPADGLLGDSWLTRHSRHTADGSPHLGMQITIMGSRVIQAVAGSRDRWALAGDNLYTDLDLSEDNLPPGSRLAIGAVLFEISDMPHTGCAKFTRRFGLDAHRFVMSPDGRSRRLRGVNATVVHGGTVHTGDPVAVVHRP